MMNRPSENRPGSRDEILPRPTEVAPSRGRKAVTGDAPAAWFPLVLTQHKQDRRARNGRALTYSPSGGPSLALYHQSHFVAVSFSYIQDETIISESRRGTTQGGLECAGGFPSGIKCVNERSPPSPHCCHTHTPIGSEGLRGSHSDTDSFPHPLVTQCAGLGLPRIPRGDVAGEHLLGLCAPFQGWIQSYPCHPPAPRSPCQEDGKTFL